MANGPFEDVSPVQNDDFTLCLPACKWVICDALRLFSDPIPIHAVHMENKHIFERPSVSSVTTNLWMYSGLYTRISRR